MGIQLLYGIFRIISHFPVFHIYFLFSCLSFFIIWFSPHLSLTNFISFHKNVCVGVVQYTKESNSIQLCIALNSQMHACDSFFPAGKETEKESLFDTYAALCLHSWMRKRNTGASFHIAASFVHMRRIERRRICFLFSTLSHSSVYIILHSQWSQEKPNCQSPMFC